MSVNTPLVRPAQSQVKIDPTARSPASDGFPFPTFKLLNKLARSTLSKPYDLSSNVHYHLHAVANSKGWSAIARFNGTTYELALLPLEDLRSAQKEAQTGSESNPTFKRVVPLQGKPNILTFANQDSHLIVALESGVVLSFDASTLCTPGQDPVQPATTKQIQSTPLKQLAANPGTEAGLSERIAIVGDGFVQIFDMALEPQGGWNASDANTNPAGVAWSPKGKHIAIGLQTGDILTFALTNMTTHHKHIPPTFDGQFVSLSWTGPGHAFRTSYASPQNPTDPGLHIVTLDTKSNTGFYYSLQHPFGSGDRTFQSPYLVQLPQWDEDAAAAEHHNALFVFGDSTSVDLEILAHDKTAWYQQSQENQVSLPLNSDMDDTTLLSLDLDLTETSSFAPIIYAYLNDGTIQGWHLEHSKPYPLMSSAASQVKVQTPSVIQPDTSMSTESDQAPKPVASAFGKPATTSAFGQSSFGSGSAFGSTGAFGQTSGTSGGFGAFASSTPSAFGQVAQSTPAPAFGASSTPAPSAFSGFGTGSTSAFGGTQSNAFSQPSTSAFSGFGNNNSGSAFGQSAFGSTGPSAFGSAPAASSTTDMTREASMADDTSGFGGLSLGSSNTDSTTTKPGGGIFGSLATGSGPSTTTPPSGSAFGGSSSVIKPSSGFMGFAPSSDSPFAKPASTPTVSAFGQSSAAPALAPPTNTTSAFGKSGFGQSGFGQPSAFGKPAFGQSAFGQSSLAPASSAASSTTGGAFSSFANKPTSFASAAQPASSSGSSPFGSNAASGGGFSAFSGTTSSFTSALKAPETESKATPAPATTSPFGAASTTPASSPSPFGSTTATSPFGTPSSSSATTTSPSPFAAATSAPTSVFGQTSTPSAFGSSSSTTPTASPFGSTGVFGKPAATSAFGQSAFATPSPAATKDVPGISSPPSSPETSAANPSALDSPLSAFKSSKPPMTTGAFGNLKASPLRPATGFGAFGASTTPSTSPFAKPAEQKPAAPVSVFASLAAGSSTSAFGKPAATPTFGSSSLVGGGAKATPPSTPPAATPGKTTTPQGKPASGGFGAFSGSSNAFSAFSGTTTSFTDMLKKGGDDFKGPKEGADAFKSKSPDEPGKAEEKSLSANTSAGKSEGSLAADTSFGDISSAGSSFVDVRAEGKKEGEEEEVHPSDDEGSEYVPSASDEEDEEDEEEGDEDDLSDDHQFDEEEEGEEREYEEEEEQGDKTKEERESTPAPPLRAGSATPQPEVPSVKVERVETPPGPSTKPSEGAPPQKSPSPTATSPASPFGIGLGRPPSTRPARSSPLAGTPVSGNEDEGNGEKAPPTPKPAAAALPTKPTADEAKKTSLFPPTLPQSKTSPAPPTSFFSQVPPRPSSTPAAPGSSTPSLFGAPLGGQAPPVFGQTSNLSATSKPSPFGGAPSAFGAPFSLTKPTEPQNAPAPSLFGKPTSPPTGGSTVPPFNLPAFSLGGPSKEGAPAPSLFGAPAPSTGAFGAATSSKSPPSSFFASPPPGSPQTGPTSPPSFSLAGAAAPTFKAPTPGSLFGAPPAQPLGGFSLAPKPVEQPVPAPKAPQTPAPPEKDMAEGMQKECAMLIISVEEELEALGLRAQQLLQRKQHLAKSAGGSWNRADLGDPSKWSLGDLKQFGQVLTKFADDLTLLKETRDKFKDEIRELNSSLLKANTRKEEIIRFNKAKTDPEFAKMLKTRSLGPEHSETQTQLRRGIRSMRDRVAKLEGYLQSSKKRLAEARTGKPSIKAPTLDTVNRTFRNIELVLSQQADEVHKLSSRLKRVNLDSASLPSTPVRDARLPDPAQRRGVHVRSTNVAVATAAALNAERAAAKLKKALLAARKEPLLNTNVNDAKPAPSLPKSPEQTPQRVKWDASIQTTISTPISFPLFNASTQTPPLSTPPSFPKFPNFQDVVLTPPSNAPDLSNFTLPDDDFSPTTHLQSGTRRGMTKKHSSVQLPKKSPGTPSPAPSTTFDWGPIPTFGNSPPLNSLAAAFTKKT